MVYPRPQTPQGESVAKPETPLLIILSISCKEVHGNMFSPLFEKQNAWTKNILGGWLKIETASYTYKSIHNKQRLSTSGIGHPVLRKGRPPQAIPSSINRHIITCYVRYQGSKDTIVYINIYTRTNYHKCPSQTRGRQEKTHCPSHRFRCLLLYLLQGTDNCAGTMGVDQLPSPTVKL